ncbi:TonB-dependent receptor [Catenovulum sp. SM1970]|uniref:TonB-dependent receptor plug domain-containing protein n=1 Tax=Marinifaba aquimaris TaxID=2741323 RepID=UPI001571C3A5|nr:TonB-dependent receptor [Marinifaba aquimaris]NTS78799.1 TonB-dependent receptor [Marinifaba aquimaris]
MQFQNKISKAVRLALVLGASSTAIAAAPQAFAAEKEVDSVERISVTGSRIKRSDFEGSTPVTVISAGDIEALGFDNVADVLRNTSFNTFGSYRASSGSSYGGAALVNLRGLGSEYTAVLINGRRVPGNAFTGTSAVDINTIPMSAVESIQILTDSASAVYGADAIGGVINIIMKKDFDQTVLDFKMEAPDRDGGERESFSVVTGTSSEKSSVLFSFEYNKKDRISDSDRDYSGLQFLSDAPIPTDGVDVTGANGGGNSGFNFAFTEAYQIGECDESFYLKMLNPFNVPGEGCGYIYSDISVMTMDVDRYSTFLDARRKIGENHEIYFENRLSKVETFGRFAPAIGGFAVAADAPINPVGDAFLLYHRFVGHGPRDTFSDATEIDTVVGISGMFEGSEIEYDFSLRKYKYTASELGQNYVLQSNVEAAVKDGSYNYIDPLSQDPDHLAAIASTKATLHRDLENDTTALQFTMNGGTGFDFGLGGDEIQWAAGAEYAEEQYQDIYDSYREAQNVLGSAGNSASGDRDRTAVYFESLIPVLENLEVNFAVRYDDYSDFDSEVSPSLSVSYAATDWLKIRASYGEGFKAPNLTNLYALPQESFEGVVDTTRCGAQGIADKDCPNAQVVTFDAGNPELQAETSTSYNLGLILEPVENFLVTLDYYEVELENVVDQLEFSDVFVLEQDGALPDGVVVNRAPTQNGVPGAIAQCFALKYPNCGILNPVANLASRDLAGADLKVQYTHETEYGNFSPELSWSHVATYDDVLLGKTFDRPGTEGYPENRANFNLNYEFDALRVSYQYQWIDETDATSGGKFKSWDQHSVNFIYSGLVEGLDISAGVRNLTDEDPSIDTEAGWTSSTSSTSMDLYPVDGRVFTFGAKFAF